MCFSMPCMLMAEARMAPGGFSREIEDRLRQVRRCFYHEREDGFQNLTRQCPTSPLRGFVETAFACRSVRIRLADTSLPSRSSREA